MRSLLFLIAVGLTGQTLLAQQAVQQPVVGATGVSTSVSVPDRGRVILGGVSSAQSGRTQFGPLRTGPATGYSREASSISVSVYVHDLHAMDEALLNSAPTTSELNRAKSGSDLANSSTNKSAEPTVSPAEKASRHEHLARKADQEGRQGVARLHWQMAAKYGSKAAEDRLAELKSESRTVSVADHK